MLPNIRLLLHKSVARTKRYSTSGYYEAQFYPYPFPILTFETVCVPHSRRKCCIDQIAKSLEKRFNFSKEVYEIPEDVEICASIFIERLQDDEARVSVLTDQREEVCVYIFGISTLPRKIEERFGIVQSIQGEQRETWITDRR